MQSPENQKLIDDTIAQIHAVSHHLPSVIIIHNVNTQEVEYMSDWGQQILKVSLPELKAMGTSYHERFFNPVDAKDYVPRVFDLFTRNDINEVFTFFQQVRSNIDEPWQWYLTAFKILLQSPEKKPLLLISASHPIEQDKSMTHNVNKLFEENTFLRQHMALFGKLSTREKEILALLAKSKSNYEIADVLNISEGTVETHRKNIKKKLEVNSTLELYEFARNFGLV